MVVCNWKDGCWALWWCFEGALGWCFEGALWWCFEGALGIAFNGMFTNFLETFLKRCCG